MIIAHVEEAQIRAIVLNKSAKKSLHASLKHPKCLALGSVYQGFRQDRQNSMYGLHKSELF